MLACRPCRRFTIACKPTGPVPPNPRVSGGRSRAPTSVLLNDALTAGGLQAAAELVGIPGGTERPHHGAIVDALGAKIGASNNRLALAKLPRELGLQAME